MSPLTAKVKCTHYGSRSAWVKTVNPFKPDKAEVVLPDDPFVALENTHPFQPLKG
jgi:hypothetical protein